MCGQVTGICEHTMLRDEDIHLKAGSPCSYQLGLHIKHRGVDVGAAQKRLRHRKRTI